MCTRRRLCNNSVVLNLAMEYVYHYPLDACSLNFCSMHDFSLHFFPCTHAPCTFAPCTLYPSTFSLARFFPPLLSHALFPGRMCSVLYTEVLPCLFFCTIFNPCSIFPRTFLSARDGNINLRLNLAMSQRFVSVWGITRSNKAEVFSQLGIHPKS